jgi:DNA invertase Pin-like site-specific DNA recombinase
MCPRSRKPNETTNSAANIDAKAIVAALDDLELKASEDLESLLNGKTRKRRRRRRDTADRGRPSDEAVREMARAYLEVQRRYWPEKIADGTLPDLTDEVLDRLVAEFKHAFLDPDFLQSLSFTAGDSIGCCYSRFSSDHSNPRSLAQQLRNELDKAASVKHFVPWSLVFADAAVTGTTAARRGYIMAKLVMETKKVAVDALFIDEIGRASRDMIEALALGRSIVEDHGKRLVGASDGFDSNLMMYKFILSMFAAMQEWFVDQLRSKVIRGQDDAFRRGSNTGLCAPGYRLEPMCDLSGNPIIGGDGDAVMHEVINDLEANVILRIFTWYAEKLRSPEWIAKRLNRIKFHNTTSWDGSRVRQLLARHTYIGIKVYRKTRQVRDRITGAVRVVKIPRKKWKVMRRRALQMIPYWLWKKTKARRKQVRDAYKSSLKNPPRRSEVYPTTLFRPICDECGYENVIGRGGKYSCFVCHNGIHGKQGCKSRGYKSVEHVEQSVLGEILTRLGDSTLPERITALANKHLAESEATPKRDTKHLDQQIKAETRRRSALIKLVADEKSEDFASVRKELTKIGAKIRDLNKQKAEAETNNESPPAPLTRELVVQYLAELRTLLYEDVRTAAPILAKLTGPIRITQVRNTGKRGWKWTAHFSLNFVPTFLEIQSARNCPKTGVWQYLNTRGWTIQQRLVVEIGKPIAAEGFVARVREILALNSSVKVSVNAIAAALGTDWNTANIAIGLASDACSGRAMAPDAGHKASKCVEDYRNRRSELIEKVVALRDQNHYSFPRLSKELQIKEGKARRLYDLGRPDKVAQAVAAGRCPARGPYSHLGPQKYQAIRHRLIAKEPVKSIAAAEGVGTSTVYRERNRLLQSAGTSQKYSG